MALITDDCDINNNSMRLLLGGNGDYYIQLFAEKENELRTSICIRISTSGDNAPSDVKIAVAQLFRAMEKHGLNEHPH